MHLCCAAFNQSEAVRIPQASSSIRNVIDPREALSLNGKGRVHATLPTGGPSELTGNVIAAESRTESLYSKIPLAKEFY